MLVVLSDVQKGDLALLVEVDVEGTFPRGRILFSCLCRTVLRQFCKITVDFIQYPAQNPKVFGAAASTSLFRWLAPLAYNMLY